MHHPRPSGQPSLPQQDHTLTATGTRTDSATLATLQAGVTPAPVFVPTTFRQPCEHCGHDVVFPFDAQLSATLDALLVSEELLQDLTQAVKEEAP
jgi:hypothetical protein